MHLVGREILGESNIFARIALKPQWFPFKKKG